VADMKNPVKAIRAKCLSCCFGQLREVELCPCNDCSLHPFRLGDNPYRKKGECTEEQKTVFATPDSTKEPEIQGENLKSALVRVFVHLIERIKREGLHL